MDDFEEHYEGFMESQLSNNSKIVNTNLVDYRGALFREIILYDSLEELI